jgi:hypothetical protein
LFKRENDHWVFSGPTPPSFNGYDKDQTRLLVNYILQLTPEEQRRVAGAMGHSQASSKTSPREKQSSNSQKSAPLNREPAMRGGGQ